jgi:signal transduction histidine kinase
VLHVVISLLTRPVAEPEPGSTEAPTELIVRIEDDGESTGHWKTGTGLASMAARCDEVGGTVASESTVNGGCVEARLPWPQ